MLFNCHWAGHVDEEKGSPLFDQPQTADSAAKQKGLAWFGAKVPGHIDESRQLGKVVETLVEQTDSEGVLVLIHLDRDARIKQATLDKISEVDVYPRVFIVSHRQNEMLAKLAAISGGDGVTLKAKGGFMGTDNVVVEAWDLKPADAE